MFQASGSHLSLLSELPLSDTAPGGEGRHHCVTARQACQPTFPTCFCWPPRGATREGKGSASPPPTAAWPGVAGAPYNCPHVALAVMWQAWRESPHLALSFLWLHPGGGGGGERTLVPTGEGGRQVAELAASSPLAHRTPRTGPCSDWGSSHPLGLCPGFVCGVWLERRSRCSIFCLSGWLLLPRGLSW